MSGHRAAELLLFALAYIAEAQKKVGPASAIFHGLE